MILKASGKYTDEAIIENNPAQYKMPFGKHKGEYLENLPLDYIEWVLANVDRLNLSIRTELENQVRLKNREGVVRKSGG